MAEEQRHWKLLGQRYRDFENQRLAGSIFRDQKVAFGWYLHWFDLLHGRIVDEYWFDKGDFFETVVLDGDGHWERGKKLTEVDPYKELCMRDAIDIWETEERQRERS